MTWLPQPPAFEQANITGLDHAVVLVQELENARRDYERLGFTLSPYSAHEELGSANHLLVFQGIYLELLAIERKTERIAHFQEMLDRSEGLWALALATPDALSTYHVMRSLELVTDPPYDFSREVSFLGEKARAQFRVLPLPPKLTPGISAFLCQHITPGLVKRREWQTHPNGATGIECLVMIQEDTSQITDLFAKAFPGCNLARKGAVWQLKLGDTDLLVMEHKSACDLFDSELFPGREQGPALAMIRFSVDDLDRTRSFLEKNATEFVSSSSELLCVPPEYCCGVAVAFSQEPAK